MLVVGLDFDGTCCEHRYPDIGADIGAIPWLLRLNELGAKIVLNTMRDGEELEQARVWLENQGVQLYGVNRNPTQDSWTTSPKVYAHVYIDDAALGTPLVRPEGSRPYVDWTVVGPMIVKEAGGQE